MLVSSIDLIKDKIKFIELQQGTGRSCAKPYVIETEISLEEVKRCYRIEKYYKDECLDDKEVLARARHALETQCTMEGKKIEYDVCNYNCEHFVNDCKIGVAVSNQINRFNCLPCCVLL